MISIVNSSNTQSIQRNLTDNIKRISEYASEIAEIVLNMNIEKTLKKTV